MNSSDTYEPIDKMCAQCGDVFTPTADDQIICISCMTDNAAIEELYDGDYESLSAWEKYADLTGQPLEETTYAGNPMLVWPHVKEYKGKKIGKVALQIGLGKARALVHYHADIYTFAQYDGKDTAYPSNPTNSLRKDKVHSDTFKGHATLHLPAKGCKPMTFGLMKAVIFAADIDQIIAFVKKHDAPAAPSAAQVDTLVDQWVKDSVENTIALWLKASVTHIPDIYAHDPFAPIMHYCMDCGLPYTGGGFYCEAHNPFSVAINKGPSSDAPAPTTEPAFDPAFTVDPVQYDMFGSVQLNLIPAIPAPEYLPMTSTTDMRQPSLIEVYQCEAHNRSYLDAAQLFASTYFEEARPIESHTMKGNILEFALLDGVTTYEVQYREGTPLVSSDVYVILRRKQ